jgi:O-acetyl-ADP-ribose deacetylase
MILEQFCNGRVTVKVGDLTDENVDAIVNAANSSLLGGGGVDGAIHHRGGPAILEACKEIRRTEYPDGLPTGRAVITPGGNLQAKFVIHTVGPIYGQNGGRDAELLADCYLNSLSLAHDNDLASIAFSSISTGAYSYPLAEAAAVSSAVIKSFVNEHSSPADIRLVFFSRAAADTFLANHRF